MTDDNVAVIAGAENLAPLLELDEAVDAAEGEGLRARWEFGCALLSRRRGKQLPNGLLDDLIKQTGKSRTELQYRVQFAERFPTEAEVSNALDTYKSWRDIVADALPADSTAQRIVASDENEWYTPRPYIEAARFVLGGIDLDPASSDSANETVGASLYYTADEDGLAQPWAGRVWLNPPYGRLAGDFTRRLIAAHTTGAVTAAILLVNAHCTDTTWFQDLWNHVLCFTDHRIDFESAGRDKTSTSTHGSVFAYVGPNPDVFATTFAPFGPIVRRWVP